MEAPQNFVFLVTNAESGPPFCSKLNRTLSLPPSTTFNDFHIAIQIAFERTNTRPYIFKLFKGPDYPISKANLLKRSSWPEIQPHVIVQRKVDDGGRAESPLDYDRLYREREDTLEHRQWLLDIGSSKDQVDCTTPLKRIPKERVSTELTVEDVWGGGKKKDEETLAIYDGNGGEWKHCIKFLKRAPPPKPPTTRRRSSAAAAPPPHPSSNGNPIVCTLGTGHPRVQGNCSMMVESALFHTFGRKTWDRTLINKRLASMDLGRPEWRGVLWTMEEGEVHAQQRFKAWIRNLKGSRRGEEPAWWVEGNVERWCKENVDKRVEGEDDESEESWDEDEHEPREPTERDRIFWEMEEEMDREAEERMQKRGRGKEEKEEEGGQVKRERTGERDEVYG